jgi:peptide/nickel transport system substrate-binding protein
VKSLLTPPAPIGTRRRFLRALVAVAAAASLLATAACQTASAEDEEDKPVEGGTLRVTLAGWPTSLDPQLTYAALEADILNLTTRTLTSYRSASGAAGSELVPDLATDLGRPNSDRTVWEFSLREGVLWETGDPVTCADLKYGVERRFSQDPDRQGGPRYPLDYLQDNDPPYEGPWVGNNNDGAGLEAVECVDQRLVRFHLSRPVGDFGYAVSMPVFAPVPPGGDDDRAGYNRRPLSSGPYLIAEHTYDPETPGDNLLVLERNPHWDRATDPHRGAYPDRFEFTSTTDSAVVTNDLVNDEGDDRSRILLDIDIAPTFLQQVMTDPELAQRVADGPMGAVRYLAVNTQRIPDVECRQVLAYAMNKRKFRSVFGGSLLGDLATSMIPPNLLAHHEFDHYGTHEHPDGQPERAREILTEAADSDIDCFGEDDRITFTYPDQPQIRRLASTVVESYQRIGVRVETVPIPAPDYFRIVLGERHGDFDLTWIGWVPDWPNGSSVIPPLFHGRSLGPGSVNLSYLDDARINEMIDTALAESDLERQYLLWGELDSEIQRMAASIPLMYNNALRMHGSNVRGAFIHPQYGMPDLSAIGLADPSLGASTEE